MAHALATIGYEQATLGAVIARLKVAGVDTVIDVRAVAASRRPGFSKTILSTSLAAEGIGYRHLRSLGTPADGRAAARRGRVAEMHAIFEAHLATEAAQAQLAEATEIAKHRHAALLCYESDHAGCHRAILAARIAAVLDCPIETL